MEPRKPSRTAWGAACHRAAHQVLEEGRIFSDPLALRILGIDAETVLSEEQAKPHSKRMRIFVVVRSRFAEDALAKAVEDGVRQLVVLGAGLDTFAYRNPFPDVLRVFEVDHPATQEWKRQRLAEAAIPLPASLTFAPIDFESDTLASGLTTAGFNISAPTFFTWLGVVPYLTKEAVFSTLSFIASLPNGAQVVFDYANPPESLAAEARLFHEERARRVAAIGEPWISHFETEDLHTQLRSFGFAEIEDLGPREIAERYFPSRAIAVPRNGGHVLRAVSLSATGAFGICQLGGSER